MNDYSRKNLLLELLRTKSYKEGIVKLSSGKESDFYIDCKQSILSSFGHRLCGEVMLWYIVENKLEVQAVAGVALGGCPLASAVSFYSSTLDALYVRKEAKNHGTKTLIEGNVPKGHKVVLLEDVVTSGQSSLTAVETLRSGGYQVDHVITLIDRKEGGKEMLESNGLTLHSIFTRSDFVKE